MEIATFGGGCFWCTEAIFQRVRGIEKVRSGYSGGHIKNPSYREVCNGTTGHAEVVQLEFVESTISYKEILEIFFATHDPTTLNKQGNDVGTQYRSIIFYHDERQKEIATNLVQDLNESGNYQSRIVTEISECETFYLAEDYHQEYYNLNQTYPYCSHVIEPKIRKFLTQFEQMVLK